MPKDSAREIEVRLFGEISVAVGGLPVAFSSAKSVELLCYLLLHSDRSHTRELLADVMWPAGRASVTKGYLRQTLWRLSRSLGDAGAGDLLRVGADRVGVDGSGRWWLDAQAVESAYLGARDVPGAELSDTQVAEIRAALDLCRGELMATWYQDWCTAERDRMQQIFLATLELLMAHCEARGRFREAADHGRRILAHDPARESTHQRLMRLHHRAGDRTSALRQFRICVTALEREFGITPSAATVRLHDRIRADLAIDPPGPPTASGIGADADVHARLDRIQAGITAVYEALQFHVGQHHAAPTGSPLRPVIDAS